MMYALSYPIEPEFHTIANIAVPICTVYSVHYDYLKIGRKNPGRTSFQKK